MSDIQLKRKKSTGSSSVKLKSGEPLYNLQDKQLYIGHNEEENLGSRKHLTEWSVSAGAAKSLLLAIGEAKDNTVTLKLAHTDINNATEGATVEGKEVTLYIDSYTKDEILDLSGTIEGNIQNATKITVSGNDGVGTVAVREGTQDNIVNFKLAKVATDSANANKVTVSGRDIVFNLPYEDLVADETLMSLNSLSNGNGTFSVSIGVGSRKDNSFTLSIGKSNVDTVVWDSINKKMLIGIDAYGKSEIDEKFQEVYQKSETYNQDEVDAIAIKCATPTLDDSSDGVILKYGSEAGNTNNYIYFSFSAESNEDSLSHSGNKGISLCLKPRYTKAEIDKMFKDGIAGQMQVVNGVLKFGKSGT